MMVAITTMPAAMVVGGIPAGIDWMHICAAPGMFLQCRACELALRDDKARKSV